MIRKIITIDEEKCNGCGLCVSACHEGAIGMVNGKAKLLREDYCDGLGDCLPVCPTSAISFEEREAEAYDHQAMLADKKKAAQKESIQKESDEDTLPCGCPSDTSQCLSGNKNSALKQWPTQIKLVNINAPYLKEADLLIAADCCAYAHANFHDEFMRDKITLIGCPKLDNTEYSEKLSHIIAQNDIKSITVARMEVPCCKSLVKEVQKALDAANSDLPLKVVTVSIDGKIVENV
ncbi:MAG: ATP-binding protein [Bacillota bacterium]|jgi:ferredoxin